jgi:50S ribosomal subunit-associated GTPase HflX
MLKEQISREKPDAVSPDLNSHACANRWSTQPIIVVANKLDLVQERQVSSQAVRDLAAKWNLPVYETSAKRNWQVANVFEELVRRIRVQYPMDEAVAKRRRRRKRDMCTVM